MISNFLDQFGHMPYFTIESLRQLSGDLPESTYRVTLSRWMKTGRVLQLKKGVYMPRAFFERHRGEAEFSLAVSTLILPQSYVSLETVLQRRGVLTEMTYPISAITLKNTRAIENKLGTFSYRHIKAEYYTGFLISTYMEIQYAQATPAKALFDYFYLRPLEPALSILSPDLAEELRLNLDDFNAVERDEFLGYCATSGSPKMAKVAKNLERYAWRH